MGEKASKKKSQSEKGRNKWLCVGEEPARWKCDMLVYNRLKKLNPASVQAPQRGKRQRSNGYCSGELLQH